jgi:hypothetical protein
MQQSMSLTYEPCGPSFRYYSRAQSGVIQKSMSLIYEPSSEPQVVRLFVMTLDARVQ